MTRECLAVLVAVIGFGGWCEAAAAPIQGSPNVTLLDNVDDHGSYNDIWGYAARGHEYALLGINNGLAVIDVTVAGSANEVAFVSGPSSTWKDIKTYGNYAYVVTESSGGMQIIDLSNLPASASLAATYNGFSTSHNITIDEANAMLYAEGTSGAAVRSISLADPLNPVQVSTFALSAHDVFARNNLVYVSEGSLGFVSVYDLSVKTSPLFLNNVVIQNSGYVHNAWPTDDDDHLMTTEETTFKTVKLFDISNLSNTSLADEYLAPGNVAHNTHVQGDLAFISHYADGLRIVDIADRENIYEAGYYDTTSSTGGFTGAWGAYPFLPSGKILVSDVSRGLFVFGFDGNAPTDLSITLTPQNAPIVIPSSGGTLTFKVSVTNHTNVPQTFDAWDEVYVPGGPRIGPFIGPVKPTLEPNSTRTVTLNQNVPGGAEAGLYRYYFKIGEHADRPLAQDSFTFTKSP
jgi:choice-of-anchor B domain-containing protein